MQLFSFKRPNPAIGNLLMRLTHLLMFTTALASPAFAETDGIEKDQLTPGFIMLTDMAPLAIV